MLGDLGLDQLDIGVRIRLAVAIQEDHHVRVLLDRSRLAQVGEPGLGAAALLDPAGELRQRDHRHLQLARELLEPAADLAHLLDPVRLALGEVALHELQVVHDQQVEPALLRLEPPSLGPQLEHGEDRRVVDPHGRVQAPARRAAHDIVHLSFKRLFFNGDFFRESVGAHDEAIIAMGTRISRVLDRRVD